MILSRPAAVLGLVVALLYWQGQGGRAFAEPADDFAASYAAAQAHDRDGAAAKNQWPATKDALTAAKKAADAHDYANAIALAKRADDLAQASLHQSKTEALAWKDAVIQ